MMKVCSIFGDDEIQMSTSICTSEYGDAARLKGWGKEALYIYGSWQANPNSICSRVFANEFSFFFFLKKKKYFLLLCGFLLLSIEVGPSLWAGHCIYFALDLVNWACLWEEFGIAFQTQGRDPLQIEAIRTMWTTKFVLNMDFVFNKM